MTFTEVDIISDKQLKEMLKFEDKYGLQSVHIQKQYEIEKDGLFISAELNYEDGIFYNLPFIWFVGEEWLFTPCDWQGYPSTSPEDIESIEWRVNDTDKAGIILNGLPRILG